MGLDQRAGYRDEMTNHYVIEFEWRKHSQLQEYMENIFRRTGGTGDFNNKSVALTREDIELLQKNVEGGDLPHCEGGFFFGHQWQDEATKYYKELDLAFCQWALDELDSGGNVHYHSDW
jgi:hypothetical protein